MSQHSRIVTENGVRILQISRFKSRETPEMFGLFVKGTLLHIKK